MEGNSTEDNLILLTVGHISDKIYRELTTTRSRAINITRVSHHIAMTLAIANLNRLAPAVHAMLNKILFRTGFIKTKSQYVLLKEPFSKN